MGKKKDKASKAERKAARKAHEAELLREADREAAAVAAPTEGKGGPTGESVRTLLRLPRRGVDLSNRDARATPGFDGDKAAGKSALAALGDPLSEWQERLFADGRVSGDARRVLLVLQGMDTAGKGGVIRKAVALVDPQGVQITSFKAPTAEER